MKAEKTIFLVRHGTTAYNQADLLQGQIDNPLNDRGIEECRKLSEELISEPIEAVFHSPLQRAKQTAEILNGTRGKEFIPIDCFKEIDLGDWEGHEFARVIEENRDFFHQWQADPSIAIPGGESFLQVFQRVKPGVKQILDSSHSTIVVVGHATVNRCILAHLLNLDPAPARMFRMRNASYSKLLVYRNPRRRYIVVESWNNTSHLKDLA
jgi:broad specificity phosphatase PhoE